MQQQNSLYTASNAISAFRGLLTIPVVYSLMYDQFTVAFWLCIFAAWTDWIDGFIARRTNTVSQWGMIIDPLADKILVGAIVVLLLAKGRLPGWFVSAIVLRDVIILVCAQWIRKRADVVMPSMMPGKLAVTAIALTGALSMVLAPTSIIIHMLMYLSSALMALSLWVYGKRLHGFLR
ncbi:MAG: CDP-alcohol phosphatidyltransferase family protein [Ignavibacteria bacterium]